MLRAFRAERGRLRQSRDIQPGDDAGLREAIWLDLTEPSEEERGEIQQFFQTELPETDDVEEIESSARYFVDQNGVHVHSLHLYYAEGRHRTTTVAFLLQRDRLITLRDTELPDFRLFRMRARQGFLEAGSAEEVLLEIMEQKVENLADTLEDIHRRLEEVSHLVLEDPDAELEDAIDELAKLEDSNGKVRLCLMDTQRALSFTARQVRKKDNLHSDTLEVFRDVDTLLSHTTFLFDKINFLMDAAQGFINIEQNQIIKIFSISAVIFLPPTLVASIYGMNFHVMPELDWTFGYPMAIGLMILSGIAPYAYFKRKGWL
ncbi:magnesium/cobalt transporter CorA [Marinobacteraceae bacterium S3BR75-40.1]